MKEIKYTVHIDKDGILRVDNEGIDAPRNKNGIVEIRDHSGNGHSCHPNINSSGSVIGMKHQGYWDKKDETVRAHGFIYNKSKIVRSDTLDFIAWVMEYHPEAPGVDDALKPPTPGYITTKLMSIGDNDEVTITEVSTEPIPENKAATLVNQIFSKEKLEDIRKQLGLKKQDFRLLLEAYRRIHFLNRETLGWVGLGTPTQYKSNLFFADGVEVPNTQNWYKLTAGGLHYMRKLNELMPYIPQDADIKSEINSLLFSY